MSHDHHISRQWSLHNVKSNSRIKDPDPMDIKVHDFGFWIEVFSRLTKKATGLKVTSLA
jgi:hypothetical protein